MGGRRGGTGQWSDRAGGLARCGFVFCDQCAAYTAVLALPNHFGLAVRPSRPSVERPFFRWRWLAFAGGAIKSPTAAADGRLLMHRPQSAWSDRLR